MIKQKAFFEVASTQAASYRGRHPLSSETDQILTCDCWSNLIVYKTSCLASENLDTLQVYGLPFGMSKRYEAVVGPPRERVKAYFGRMKFWRRSKGGRDLSSEGGSSV